MKKKSILVLVLLLAIGFASVTTTLIINGVANIGFNEDDFGVIFTYANISDKKASKATISEDKKTITFKTGELSKKGEVSILDYTVKNISTQYDAKAKINCTTVNSDYVKLKNVIDSRDITNMDDESDPIKLAINESKNGKLTVEVVKAYLGDDKLDIDVSCKMILIPIEPDDPTTTVTPPTSTTTTTPSNVERVVKVDPNGGLYKGSSNIYITEPIETGNTYEIEEEPIKEGYRFTGWQVTEEGVFDRDTNIVTMKQNDIVLIANWEAVDNVARIEDTYYPSIQSAIKDARKEDTIHLLKDTTENPVNNKEVTLDLGGYKVTGTLTNEKTITILNGTIESTTSSAVINNGTLTLGENDLDEDDNPKVSVDSVALIGTNKGLEQNGVFNFYDGYIEGSIGIAGGYNDKPVGYIVFVDHNDEKDCQKVYLIDEAHISRTVAKTIETGEIYYYNLQDALNTTFDNEMVVYAIRNFEAPHTVTIPEGSTGVFDITGYTVETGYTITNNGEFTLIDSATEKGALKPSVVIINNGKLHIKDITITETTSANIIENNGELDIKNSTITGLAGYAVKNITGTKLTMDNDTNLKANTYALYNETSENFTVSGGNVYGFKIKGNTTISNGNYYNNDSNHAVYNEEATTVINDINVISTKIGIYNTGILTVNKGTINKNTEINATTGIENQNQLTIRNMEIVANTTGIYNIATVYVINSKITSNGVGVSCYQSTKTVSRPIYGNLKDSNIISSSYGISMKGGNFDIDNSNITSLNSHGIYYTYGITNLKNSTVIGKNAGAYSDNGSVKWGNANMRTNGSLNVENSTIEGQTGNGIWTTETTSEYLNIKSGTIKGATYGIYSQTTLTIGTNDNIINNDNITIIGSLYGIYIKSGTTSFYDGKLKGKTAPYDGIISIMADAVEIESTTENINSEEYQVCYPKEHDNYLKVSSVEYNSLQKAIDAIETEGTIEFMSNSSSKSQSTVPNTKNITIDLKGYMYNISQPITNDGILKIKDSSLEKTGTILTDQVISIFESNGTTLIENVKFIKHNSSNYVMNIKNGTTTLKSIEITSDGNGINVSSTSANLIIENMELIATKTGILNKGTLTINTGTINKDTDIEITTGISNERELTIENVDIVATQTGIDNIGTMNITECNITSNSIGISTIQSNKTISYPIEVTLTNSDIISNSYAINMKGKVLNIDNSNITSLNNHGLYYTNGTTTLKNSTVTGKKNGAYGDKGTIKWGNANMATHGNMIVENSTIEGQTENGIGIKENSSEYLNIISGTIKGATNGIYSQNVLTIGIADEIIDNSNINIIGQQYGVYIENGQTDFYDGKLKGKNGAYYGILNKMPDASIIKEDTETIDGEIYQVDYPVAHEKFLIVDGVEYNSLQKAIDAIETEGIVEFKLSSSSKSLAIVSSGKKVTIDLKGYTYETTQALINNGELIIKDSSIGKTGNIVDDQGTSIIENYGILTIEEANLTKTEASKYAIDIKAGTATIENVNINTVGSAINVLEDASLTIEDMTLVGKNIGIENYGTLTINNGKINKDVEEKIDTGIENYGTLIAKNLNINAEETGIYSKKSIQISNSIINSDEIGISVYQNDRYTSKPSVAEVNNCTITALSNAINMQGENLKITGGNITSLNENGIYMDYGTTTLKNSTVIGKTNGIYSVQGSKVTNSIHYTTRGNLVVDNSTIKGLTQTGIFTDHDTEGYTTILSGEIIGNIYGIYSSGIVTIGEQDNIVNNDNISILGNEYGVYYEKGTINFYDGKLKGKTEAFNKIKNIEIGKMIVFGSEVIETEMYFTAWLDTQNDFVSNATNTYDNLQTVINDAASGDTLVFTQDASIHYEINISDSKNITIDLAGHELNLAYNIENFGTLTIQSDEENAKIKTLFAINIINNGGTLTIDNVIMENNNASNDIINNEGILTLNSVNIDGKKGLFNSSDGMIDINTSIITATDYAVKNEGILNINHGTYTGTNYAIYSLSTNICTIVNATLTSENDSLYNSNSTYELNTSNLTGNLISNNGSNIVYNGGDLVGSINNIGVLTLTNINIKPDTYMENNEKTFVNNTGILSVTGGKIELNKDGSYKINVYGISNTGTVTLTDTMVELNDSQSDKGNLYAIRNINGGNLEIINTPIISVGGETNYGLYLDTATSIANLSNSNINVDSTQNANGIFINNGSAKIKDGNIISSGTNAYGIYIENGEVTLGTKDGAVSTDKPYVEAIGTNSGIGVKKVNGLFKYYDGKLLGSTNAKPDTTTDTEHNYEATFYHDANNYEYCILEFME